MKKLLVILCSAFVSLAHAQSVDWNRAWSGCSAEAREFDANAQGASTDSQGVKRWVENNTGSPSTNIAGLQRKLDEDRGHLSDRSLLIRLSAKLAICGSTAALNQLQSGSFQSAAAPSRPARSSEPASGSGRDRPDLMASRCLDFSGSRLRNNCNQKLSVNWCSNDYGTHGCGNSNLGWTVLDPGDSTYVSAQKVYWFACAAPARPSEVEYLPGSGLRAACTQ